MSFYLSLPSYITYNGLPGMAARGFLDIAARPGVVSHHDQEGIFIAPRKHENPIIRMAENKTTGSSDISPVPDLAPGTNSTLLLTKELHFDPAWPGTEPAMRQVVDVGMSSLRTHFDDCISATNSKLDHAEAIFKAKLDNVEIKLNARIDLLDKDVQSIKDKSKIKKDKRWDIRILCITIIVTIAVTLWVENWIIPWLKK